MITASQYNRSNFTIYRFSHNVLDFLIRDFDRQPIVITGTLTLYIWDNPVTRSLLDVALTAVNSAKGHWRATIDAETASTLRAGKYYWSVANAVSAVEKLLYVDTNYLHRGHIEVVEGLLPEQPDAVTITNDDIIGIDDNLYATSSFVGSALRVNSSGNHVVVFQLDEYTGTVRVQCSQADEVPTEMNEWTDCAEYEFDDVSGTQSRTFTGNYTYVRFLFVNSISGIEGLSFRN